MGAFLSPFKLLIVWGYFRNYNMKKKNLTFGQSGSNKIARFPSPTAFLSDIKYLLNIQFRRKEFNL